MTGKFINPNNLSNFAYVNLDICKKPYKGIIYDFIGLGGMTFTDDPPYHFAEKCSERNILYIMPYLNPWNWMNDTAIKTMDMIVDVVIEKTELKENSIIVSTGGSMGGLCALTYSAKAKITPNACAANCPVCDSVFHEKERPDLPRTYVSAFLHYGGDLSEAISTSSPFSIVEKMPKIPYYIVHGTEDTAVNIKIHSDPFVKKMRSYGHDITYDVVEGMGHCNISSDNEERYYDFIFSFFK